MFCNPKSMQYLSFGVEIKSRLTVIWDILMMIYETCAATDIVQSQFEYNGFLIWETKFHRTKLHDFIIYKANTTSHYY